MKNIELLRFYLSDNKNIVNRLANSNIPNEYFIKQFESPDIDIYINKTNWEIYAKVLINRGINKIQDVMERLLLWAMDTNWPGYLNIEEFIISNINLYATFIKKYIKISFEQKDIGWFKNLLSIYLNFKDETLMVKKKINEIIIYLENDDWLEFETKYLDFLNVILK